jgi:hypothetical protein
MSFLRTSLSHERDHSQRNVVVNLFARCIQREWKALLDLLIATEDWVFCSTDVLVAVLHFGTSAEEFKVCELQGFAAEVVLADFATSPYVRMKVSENAALFTCAPTFGVVRRLAKLAFHCAESSCIEHVHILLDALLETLRSSLYQENSEPMGYLVKSLREQAATGNETSTNLVALLGTRWRMTLLHEPTSQILSFGRILAAVGREMLAAPSCNTTLKLFGHIAGDHIDLESTASCALQKVVNATELVLHLCIDDMQSTSESYNTFQRFAPLLLLRRLPSCFFRIPRQSDCYIDKEKWHTLLTDLGKHMALRLDVDSDASAVVYSSDERCLAAEIAGRSLPLGSQKQCSSNVSDCGGSYELICKPAFQKVKQMLQSGTKGKELERRLNSAKAALFSVIVFIPTAKAEEHCGAELLLVSSFALEVLQIKNDSSSCASFEQLQTGSIEFFALCFERLLKICSDRENGPSDRASSPNGYSKSTPLTFAEAINHIFDEVFHAARTGSILPYDRNIDKSVEINMKGMLCLWNSFVLVAQKCQESVLLNRLRTMLLPKTLEWGNGDAIDRDVRHPLCVAAALQLARVLLYRTKTENCDWNLMVEDKRDYLPKAYSWALKALKMSLNAVPNSQDETSFYSSRSLIHSSALQLIVATVVLADDATNGVLDYVTVQDVSESLMLFRQLAESANTDDHIRELAVQFLCTLGTKPPTMRVDCVY